MNEAAAVDLEAYRQNLLTRLDRVYPALSKMSELSKIFDKEWYDILKEEIKKTYCEDLKGGFRSDKGFMFFMLGSSVHSQSWYQEILNMIEAEKENELTDNQKFVFACFGTDPVRSFLPKFEERLKAFALRRINGKEQEVTRKLKELRDNRFSRKFREFGFEVGVLGFFALKGVLTGIEISDGQGGTIDGQISLDSRSILIEITHTSEEILSIESEAHAEDVNRLVNQTAGKIRKKVADGRQLATASGIPCVLFLARNPLGADEITSKWGVDKCFSHPDFAKLSGVVFSDTWSLVETEFHVASNPEICLNQDEIEILNQWFGK